jgi:hypothetical protein
VRLIKADKITTNNEKELAVIIPTMYCLVTAFYSNSFN